MWDVIEKYGVTVFYTSDSDSGVYQMGEHLLSPELVFAAIAGNSG